MQANIETPRVPAPSRWILKYPMFTPLSPTESVEGKTEKAGVQLDLFSEGSESQLMTLTVKSLGTQIIKV